MQPTLIISLCALLISLLSFAWNVYQFRDKKGQFQIVNDNYYNLMAKRINIRLINATDKKRHIKTVKLITTFYKRIEVKRFGIFKSGKAKYQYQSSSDLALNEFTLDIHEHKLFEITGRYYNYLPVRTGFAAVQILVLDASGRKYFSKKFYYSAKDIDNLWDSIPDSLEKEEEQYNN